MVCGISTVQKFIDPQNIKNPALHTYIHTYIYVYQGLKMHMVALALQIFLYGKFDFDLVTKYFHVINWNIVK